MAAMIDLPSTSLAALATTALLLVACGGDEPAASTTSAGSTSSTSSAATTTGSGGTGGEGTGGGGVGGGSAGGGGSGGAAFSTAAHTPFPELVFHGEAVIAHPKLVTITFPGYRQVYVVFETKDGITASAWLRGPEKTVDRSRMRMPCSGAVMDRAWKSATGPLRGPVGIIQRQGSATIHLAEQLPGLAVELGQLLALDRVEVVGPGLHVHAGQQHRQRDEIGRASCRERVSSPV